MMLLLLAILSVVAIPAAIFLVTVVTSGPRNTEVVIKSGLKHFGTMVALAAAVAVVVVLVFQC